MVVIATKGELLDLLPSDVVRAAKLAVDVLESVVRESVRRILGHLQFIEIEPENAILLAIAEAVVLPGELRSTISSLMLRCYS